MKLEDVRKAYDYFSGKCSDLVRQLAFAGIALVWVFKTELSGHVVIPIQFRNAALLIAISLALDFLQYVIASLIWGSYNRILEGKKIKPTGEFKAPRALNWPGIICFWGKIASILWAYALIIPFLATRVWGQ